MLLWCAVGSADRPAGAAAARRLGGAAASGRAAVRRRQLKKCLLVLPADHWPNVDSGISMKQTGGQRMTERQVSGGGLRGSWCVAPHQQERVVWHVYVHTCSNLPSQGQQL